MADTAQEQPLRKALDITAHYKPHDRKVRLKKQSKHNPECSLDSYELAWQSEYKAYL